jgi:putative ubiquitin-RnfH superfamily antitoxin RatB of RatAB toxin-antitoxin module
MKVEVAYAKPEVQVLLTLEIEPGDRIEAAIRASGILERFPEIDLERNPVGVFGTVRPLDHVLRPGDRVEIYRPLLADPKEARRIRATRK